LGVFQRDCIAVGCVL